MSRDGFGSPVPITDLSDANLTNADLSYASLLWADLWGADLTGVSWYQTTCPDGTVSSFNFPASCEFHLI